MKVSRIMSRLYLHFFMESSDLGDGQQQGKIPPAGPAAVRKPSLISPYGTLCENYLTNLDLKLKERTRWSSLKGDQTYTLSKHILHTGNLTKINRRTAFYLTSTKWHLNHRFPSHPSETPSHSNSQNERRAHTQHMHTYYRASKEMRAHMQSAISGWNRSHHLKKKEKNNP